MAERRDSMSDFSNDSNLSGTTTTHVSSSSDEDLGPEDSATIEPYQFEPVDGEHRDDSQTDESADDDPQNDPRLGNTDW